MFGLTICTGYYHSKIKFLCDNLNVVKHMRGATPGNKGLRELKRDAMKMWEVAKAKGNKLSIEHTKGKNNLADKYVKELKKKENQK